MWRENDNGVALLLALGVLAVLSVLAVSFVRMQSIERDAGSQHVAAARARMMVRAGVTYAVARLRDQARATSYDRPDAPWIYRGEDVDGNGLLDRSEDVFQPERGELDGLDCPLGLALAPSFPHQDNAKRLSSGLPAVSALLPSVSGSFTEAGAAKRAFYLPGASGGVPAGHLEAAFTLRVIDCASQIDVNGGRFDVDGSGRLIPRATADTEYTGIVAGVIDRLWEAIRTDAGLGEAFDFKRLGGMGLGKYLIERVGPTGRYHNKHELRQAVESISTDLEVGAETWRRVAPLLTCHAWRDPTVIRPAPGAAGRVDQLPRLERLSPLPRAPININTASWRVLHAILSGLSGRNLRDVDITEVPRGELYAPDYYEPVVIDDATARTVALEIVRYRRDPSSGKTRPFRNWNDFDAFIDDLLARKVLTYARAALLRAQAAPDSQLNKFNPDTVAYRSMDKSDLVAYRTEFCFSSMGMFEVTSLGRVLYRQHTMAEDVARTVVRVYEVIQDTTFADFEAGTIGPASAPQPRLAITPGVSGPRHALGRGPEPRAVRSGHSPFDGRIGLAPISAKNKLALRFRADLRAVSDSGHPIPSGVLLGKPTLTTVFLGGGYSEYRGRKPAYPYFDRKPPNNKDKDKKKTKRVDRFDKKRGAISFWYKPNFDIGTTTRPHSILDINGKKDKQTFQLYFEGGPVDRVAPVRGVFRPGPKLVLLFYDGRSKKEVKIELPLFDPEGYPIADRNAWMYISLLWDEKRVLLGYVREASQLTKEQLKRRKEERKRREEERERLEKEQQKKDKEREKLRKKKKGKGGPVVLEDDTPDSGPIVAFKPTDSGGVAGAYWEDDDDDLGDGKKGPRFEFGDRLRLGGPLRYRRAVFSTKKVKYQGMLMAPSNGTYADLRSYLIDKPPKLKKDKESKPRPSRGRRGRGWRNKHLIVNPDETWVKDVLKLGTNEADYEAILELFMAGRYYNGDRHDLASPAPYARFDSRVLERTRGHPVGTISWRAHLPSTASLDVRILRKRAGKWVEILDAKGNPVSHLTPGDCGISRASLHRGFAPAERGGPIRYRVYFLDSVPADEPVLETALLDSVQLTLLTPIAHMEWQWLSSR